MDGAGPRALVVDDDHGVGRAIYRLLRREGFEVVVTVSGYDALALLEQGERFHLVVSDIQMPELDGFAFLDAARVHWPQIDAVIVFVTGGCLERRPSTRWFEKPLREEFLEHVREVARRARDLPGSNEPA